jgi:DNA helicase-2/ATP-dependent DNA helicase PcrA
MNVPADLVRRRWLDNHFYGQIAALSYVDSLNDLTMGGGWSVYDGLHFGTLPYLNKIFAPDNYRYYDNDALKKEMNTYVKWERKFTKQFKSFIDLQYRYVNHQMNGFTKNTNLTIERKFNFFNPKMGLTYQAKNIFYYTSVAVANKEPNRDDFEDVLLLTVGMLEEDRGVRERVQDQYRYFTVDEYQDVSPLQQRLLNLWLGSRQEICVVGDAAQTIYSFAGATSNFLLNFQNRFPNAQVFRLSRGYRSTPEIINTANAILRAANLVSDHGSELQSANAHGEKPAVNGFNSTQDEISYVVGEVVKRISEGVDSSQIAVLARTNAQLDQVKSALNNARIPSQIRSGERFFDRTDVRDVMRIIRSASVLPSEGGDWYADLVAVLRPFGDADYVVAFLRLAKSIQENGGKNMRAFLREIEDRSEQNNPPTLPGVTLATLHAAKGLEWNHLFLIGVSEGVLPMGNDLNEERRLFYVGVTRAKERIQITYAGKPSVFLAQFN